MLMIVSALHGRVIVFVLRVLMIMFLLPMPVSMQIGHVMVVIFYTVMKDYIEVAGPDGGFGYTADLNVISIQRQGSERILKLFFICSQIKQSGNGHIAADTAGTV